MHQGIYEEIITKLVQTKLNELDRDVFFIGEKEIDIAEAKNILSHHFYLVLTKALSFISKSDSITNQIELVNKLILILRDELDDNDFKNDLVDVKGQILNAIYSKIDIGIIDFESFKKEVTPGSRLIFSSLFTGGSAHNKYQMDGELRKEINSSDQIDLLVSFIKWEGLRLIMTELKQFTKRGGKLRIITTTYVGATDAKCVEFLSKLRNCEVKVSYNTQNERVHVKAYLFKRTTGFNTAYIGSSNISKTALTKGLEWNVKITNKDIPHVIEPAFNTFETYWHSSDFETYNHETHSEKLKIALKKGKFGGSNENDSFTLFDIKPYKFQEDILEKLEVERTVHNRYKNLIVAATGTGKTVISAFDFKRFLLLNENAKLLFVAHRKEILQQSLGTFRGILKNQNFGELWVDGIEPSKLNHVFASVQTLSNRLPDLKLTKTYFDFIIIDEVHHLIANSYRPIIERFNPIILLGLTATPERMDGGDILEDFCDHIAAEIRLPEALNQKLLSPFNYFGITDSVDISNVTWLRGRYVPSELSQIYTKNDQRVSHIIQNLEKYVTDILEVRALGFCVTQEHAKYMAAKFTLAKLKADYLIAGENNNRSEIRERLRRKEINYLFVVDIFNEGVDIPEIDTILFLRPTESLTVFLQQLGRGLRLSDGKDCLTVLDFVGNSHAEYDFEGKFRALVGKTNTPIGDEIEGDFPHLPLGCSIILEKKAKETILKNFKSAYSPNRNQIIQKIKSFQHQTTLKFNLKNFSEFFRIPIETIFKRGSWQRLCQEAGKIDHLEIINETEVVSCISKKWLSTNSYYYFKFLKDLAKLDFNVSLAEMTENEKSMCLMLHYDFWQQPGGFDSIENSIKAIGRNKQLNREMEEVLEILIDKVSNLEKEIELPYNQPLKLHARYTRDQILVAFGFSSFNSKSSNREGVAYNPKLNTELLFIDLIKSEESFSPTTMYDDYAINEILFHWQSQNSARPDKGKGLSYINHLNDGKRILLFVREQKTNEYKNTMGYVFIGEGKYQEHYGSKPMSINWELNEPLPVYLWGASAKFSIA